MAWGNLIHNLRKSTRPVVRSSGRDRVRRIHRPVVTMPFNRRSRTETKVMRWPLALLSYALPAALVTLGGMATVTTEVAIAHDAFSMLAICMLALILLARAMAADIPHWTKVIAVGCAAWLPSLLVFAWFARW